MKKIILSSFVFLNSLSAALAVSSPPGALFTYEGQLTDLNDNPITTTKTIKFSILALDPTECIMFEENQTVTPNSHGEFSVVIGNGVRLDSTGNGASGIFALNSQPVCTDGSNMTPASGLNAAGNIRYLRVTVDSEAMSPEARISAVPYSLQALRLNDKKETDFINIDTTKNLTQANAGAIFQNFTKLDALLTNTNSSASTITANLSGNATTATSATTATNVTGTVAIANGGTGATTVAGARTNLGLGPLAVLSPTGTADNSTYLRGDGTWAAVATGSGAVTSVASKTGVVTLVSSDLTDFSTATNTLINTKLTSVTNANNGLAGLDSSGKILSSVLPASPTFNLLKASNLGLVNSSSEEIGLTAPASGVTNYNIRLPASPGAVGQILKINAVSGSNLMTQWMTDQTAASGSGLTSVGLSLPNSVFQLSGNPLTADGTITANFVTQNQSAVFAGPNGSSGAPSFRQLSVGDLSNSGSAAMYNVSAAGDAGLSEVVKGNDSRLTDWRIPLNGSVITAKITDNAVTEEKLATNSVTTTKIADGSVTSAKLSSSLSADKIKGVSVGTVTADQFLQMNSSSSGWIGKTLNGITTTSSDITLTAGSTDRIVILKPTSSTAGDRLSVQISRNRNTMLGSGDVNDASIYLGESVGTTVGAPNAGIETGWVGASPQLAIGVIRDGAKANMVMTYGGLISFRNASTTNMFIASDGKVGIGTTGPSEKLEVVGNIKASGCVTYYTGNTGSCLSDIRLKKDIRPFALGLEVVLGIQPKFYRYNGLAGTTTAETPMLGVIAQDLEKVAPSLIIKEDVKLHPTDTELTAIKKVNYGSFTYVIINAVKEFYAKWQNDSEQIHHELASVKEENEQMKQWICSQDDKAAFCNK